jgi:hypothetical protein
MNCIYIDIETIPAASPEIRDLVAQTVKPPAAMKKAETIAAWEANDKAQAIEEALAKTSLDGAYGSIYCIGAAFNDLEPVVIRASSEQGILREFCAWSDEVLNAGRAAAPVLVGHNIINFDIRFIWQRAIILGVQMPRWFPRDPKPWSGDVFDTMLAFAGQRNTIGMDRLCSVLGFPGKGNIDGSMIGKMYAEGRHDEIAAYCIADVERTRKIHQRMQIAFGEAA